MSIILDKEKGVDPMIVTCFVCGKDKNQLILPGIKGKALRKSAGLDPNAKSICMDKVPCDKCQNIMQQGVILISVKDEDVGSNNPFRTGGWCAMKVEAFKNMCPDIDTDKQRIVFVPDSIYDKIGLPRNVEINNMEGE